LHVVTPSGIRHMIPASETILTGCWQSSRHVGTCYVPHCICSYRELQAATGSYRQSGRYQLHAALHVQLHMHVATGSYMHPGEQAGGYQLHAALHIAPQGGDAGLRAPPHLFRGGLWGGSPPADMDAPSSCRSCMHAPVTPPHGSQTTLSYIQLHTATFSYIPAQLKQTRAIG